MRRAIPRKDRFAPVSLSDCGWITGYPEVIPREGLPTIQERFANCLQSLLLEGCARFLFVHRLPQGSIQGR
jgi:hypothetical protein